MYNFEKLLKEYNNLKGEKKDIQNSLLRMQKQLDQLEEKEYRVKGLQRGVIVDCESKRIFTTVKAIRYCDKTKKQGS